MKEREELQRILEYRRDREIEQMFTAYSNSNYIDISEYWELTRFKIDQDFYMLVELLGKKLDRERKKNTVDG